MFYNALTNQPYSTGNIQRLAAEYDGPETTDPIPAAGFKQWLELGRCVAKGQHGHKVMMVCDKITDKETGDKAKVCKTRTVFFHHQTVELGEKAA